jgi:hypothetical protein
MPVLVPLVGGLKITERVQAAPTSMVCPQSVASMKSVESLARILMPEIVCAIGVSLVITMLAGMLPVSTGWTANEITERDKRTLGSVGGETRAKVAALVGASELFQWDGTPELSNVEGKTPSVSFLAVVGERLILGSSARVETAETTTPTSAFSARTRRSAKIRAKAATGHNRALQDPFDLDSPQISNLLYTTQSFLLPTLR